MKKGKDKCEILKKIRKYVAKKYGLDYESSECTHEDIGSTLNPLPAIVGKGKRILVQPDTVTENTADGGCSYQIVIESLFLQCIILGKSCLIYEIHGFLHGIADILVIRSQCEEEMMKHLNITLCLYIEGLFHGGLLDKNRDISIQDIYLFLGITYHTSSNDYAAKADDHAAYEKEAADDHYHFNLVF